MGDYKEYCSNTRIDKTARIKQYRTPWVDIGNNVSIDMGVYISTQIKIGDYVHIAQHVCIIGGKWALLEMADFTNIGAGSKIVVMSDDFTMSVSHHLTSEVL